MLPAMGKNEHLKYVDPTPDDPALINPLNGEPMDKILIGVVRIDRCAKTGAIWLDQGELAQLSLLGPAQKAALKQLDVAPDGGAAKRSGRGPIKSPRTGTVMMVVNDPDQKHIEFEVDPDSGGCFFDAGELTDLTEYTFKERLRAFLG